MSFLINTIIRIVLIGSKEKMSGVYARLVVAVMEYAKTFRNRTMMDFPRNPMCADLFPFTDSESPITCLMRSSHPEPTSAIWFGHQVVLKSDFDFLPGSNCMNSQLIRFKTSCLKRSFERANEIFSCFSRIIFTKNIKFGLSPRSSSHVYSFTFA